MNNLTPQEEIDRIVKSFEAKWYWMIYHRLYHYHRNNWLMSKDLKVEPTEIMEAEWSGFAKHDVDNLQSFLTAALTAYAAATRAETIDAALLSVPGEPSDDEFTSIDEVERHGAYGFLECRTATIEAIEKLRV